MVLRRADADLIEEEARRAFPREACGVLVGSKDETGWLRIVWVEPAVNVAPSDRPDRFEIDPALLLRLHRELRGGREAILGHYHSHPGGEPRPSAADAAEAHWPGLAWLIVGVDDAGRTRLSAFLHPEGAPAPAPFIPLALEIESAAPA